MENIRLRPVLRPPRFAVQLAVHNASFALPGPMFIKNLSSRGAFLQTRVNPTAERMEFEFGFPGQRSRYRVQVRVIWRGHLRGIGVHFLTFLAGSEEELINDLKYWGELSKVRGAPKASDPQPGCYGMPQGNELQMYLSSIDEKDIDDILDRFVRNSRH